MATLEDASVVSAWKVAGTALDIEVVAPFTFTVSGRTHECSAFLPHFGREGGIVVAVTSPPDFVIDTILAKDAKARGFDCSFVNVELYRDFDRTRFVSALVEWGFTGPEDKRPSWWASGSS